MNASLFWFSDEQRAKIKPHLPTKQPGPERKDDRRILSGIMHVQRAGCRWQDCPSEYGPHKTSTIALPAGVSAASGRRWATLSAKGRQIETEAAPIRYVAELIGPDTDPERQSNG